MTKPLNTPFNSTFKDIPLTPDWKKFQDGLVPCIVQSNTSQKVLMLAYLSQTSFENTLATGTLTFYSRSRQALWVKGETSGNTLKLISLSLDCDQDTFLATVIENGPTCHRGTETCFEDTPRIENEEDKEASPLVLNQVYSRILSRKENPLEGSYTSYLFEAGLDKILKKVGEESSEVIIAAKNEDPKELIDEVSDLLYHLLALLAFKGIKPLEIYRKLMKRQAKECNLKPQKTLKKYI